VGGAADGPELTAAKQLLDCASCQGFVFQRVAPGPDGPLCGVRETIEYRDTYYLGGFGAGCSATRARKSSLIVPGGAPACLLRCAAILLVLVVTGAPVAEAGPVGQ
jgi:hypothetical protein